MLLLSFVYFVNRVCFMIFFFFFNDTATTEIYTLSLHDALPISVRPGGHHRDPRPGRAHRGGRAAVLPGPAGRRSEEHTSELQSRLHLVCRLLLEKKKKNRQQLLFRQKKNK